MNYRAERLKRWSFRVFIPGYPERRWCCKATGPDGREAPLTCDERPDDAVRAGMNAAFRVEGDWRDEQGLDDAPEDWLPDPDPGFT